MRLKSVLFFSLLVSLLTACNLMAPSPNNETPNLPTLHPTPLPFPTDLSPTSPPTDATIPTSLNQTILELSGQCSSRLSKTRILSYYPAMSTPGMEFVFHPMLIYRRPTRYLQMTRLPKLLPIAVFTPGEPTQAPENPLI